MNNKNIWLNEAANPAIPKVGCRDKINRVKINKDILELIKEKCELR